MFFIAQDAAAIDPVAGGAGWVGAGLLGLIVYWLAFHHLPSKDKQVSEIITMQNARLDSKDKQVIDLCDTHAAVIKETVQTFSTELKEERKSREASEQRFAQIAQGLCRAERK